MLRLCVISFPFSSSFFLFLVLFVFFFRLFFEGLGKRVVANHFMILGLFDDLFNH